MSYAEARQLETSAIPVIDLAGRTPEVSAAMLAAAENTGFFYIRNPGVPQLLIDRVFELSRRFFAAPLAVKREVAVKTWHRGFVGPGAAKMTGDAKPDLKESFV